MKNVLHAALMLLVASQLSFGETRKSAPATATQPIPEGRHVAHPHEVLLNSHNYLTYAMDMDYSAAAMSFNNGTKIGIGGAYYYRIMPFLQVGPRLGLNYLSTGGASSTTFEILGAARINFPFDVDFENSFFGGVQFGLLTTSIGAAVGAGTSATSALIGFEGGKRFALLPNVTWQPRMAFMIPTNGAFGSVSIQFHLLSASIIF